MKFLCVACDEAMKLQDAMPAEDPGTLAVVYCCPECDRQMAMLTNPWETQLVQSLGVKIGPGAESESTGCPFAGAVQGLQSAETESLSTSETTSPPASAEVTAEGALVWTPAALARLERIPEFVRPMARQGIEHWARDHGWPQVTEEVLEAARGGMGL